MKKKHEYVRDQVSIVHFIEIQILLNQKHIFCF